MLKEQECKTGEIKNGKINARRNDWGSGCSMNEWPETRKRLVSIVSPSASCPADVRVRFGGCSGADYDSSIHHVGSQSAARATFDTRATVAPGQDGGRNMQGLRSFHLTATRTRSKRVLQRVGIAVPGSALRAWSSPFALSLAENRGARFALAKAARYFSCFFW